jgi:tRNA 2-thiouridine synthesizing protein B
MLHTVNRSPFERSTLESCLTHMRGGHALLLIEDGVYGGTVGTSVQSRLEATMKTCRVYALRADVEARGLQPRLLQGVTLVDYGGFVDLALEYPAVHAWL